MHKNTLVDIPQLLALENIDPYNLLSLTEREEKRREEKRREEKRRE
jgi:hypothetical protein